MAVVNMFSSVNVLLYFFLLIGVQAVDFYSFKVTDIEGDMVSLEQYRGKPSLVVNVASECGYTHNHYEALSQLSKAREIKDHLNILAFPCNQFGFQEPGSNAQISQFAKQTYNCNFPLFSKIDVIGDNAHPVYKYLAEMSGVSPNWNFWKYLVNRDGQVVNVWGPQTDVHDLWNDLVSISTRRVSHEDL
ncbi:glutathione peroxidase 7-like [Antedon mediterranea]|uniref:glutathione peroxidase 7-like n=1 Tax=Antedon mediterranea TaxID=105859 RepID=UPI003AF73ADD